MTITQKKFFKWILLVCGVSLILFIIIFTPCFTELIFQGSPELFAVDVVLIVMLPLSIAINCFLGAYILREFTTERMLALLELGFKKGTMDLETYKTAYKNITLFKVFQQKANEEAKAEAKILETETENKVRLIAQSIAQKKVAVELGQAQSEKINNPVVVLNLEEVQETEELDYEEEEQIPVEPPKIEQPKPVKRTPLF